MQQKSSSSNSNGQFVTITDKDRAEIIRQVNSDFTLKATSWIPLGNGTYSENAVRVFGYTQNQNPIIIKNGRFFTEVFVPNIARNFLTQNKNSTTLTDLFNAPSTLLDPKYNKLDVQYIILSEMNRILMQTAEFYRLNSNTLKEKGWDFESFEAVKEFKKANVAPQNTPKTTGPMDRFAKSGVAITSSAPRKKQTPTSPSNSLKKMFAKTPKTALATSNDSDDNLSSHHSGSSVASTSDHKQAAAVTTTTAAVAIPAVLPNSNDSSEASTSLKDLPKPPVAAAAALLVVNAGQNSNSVNVAYLSSASRTVTTQRLSTPKKNTTVRFNVSANGRITPLSPRAANSPTKRTSHVAGLREEDNAGSPYKVPRTKENHSRDRSPSF